MMTTNLLDCTSQLVNRHAARFAEILGESHECAESLVETSIPPLFGGLVASVGTESGTDRIAAELPLHGDTLLDALDGLLQGGNHVELLQRGNRISSMLLGDKLTAVVEAIARDTGQREGNVVTVLRLLAPIVFGVTIRELRSSGGGKDDVQRVLTAQRETVASRVSQNIAERIGLPAPGSTVIDDGVGAGSGRLQAPVGNAGNGAPRAAAGSHSSAFNLFLTLVPLAILAGIALFVSQRVSQHRTSLANRPIPEIKLPGFDAASHIRSFETLAEQLRHVRDQESARATLPALRDTVSLVGEFDLGAIAAGPEKESVGTLFSDLITELKEPLESAYQIDGVREILEPEMLPFLASFEVFGV